MSIAPLVSEFDAVLDTLRQRLTGAVLLPHDEGYDEARTGFNLAVSQHPAVIVVPETAAEVADAVRAAWALGLRVAVQATGHGVARPADGALLIVTAKLDQVTIDPVARTARVSAGARWAHVLEPAQDHGLAPLLGSSPGVGAVGYTLGGGMGWLARRFGLASDSVRSFDLVTPDGTPVHTSPTERPELFWALKGGGAGSLGIVTAMEIDLYPVDTVYAGNLFYPVEAAGEVLRRWRTWVDGVGTELTSSVSVMNFPPFEEVPEAFRGRSFVIVRGCWSGDLDAGAALVDEWRAWRTPEIDLFGPMPFRDIAAVSMDPVDPIPAMLTTEWFDELDDRALDVVVTAAAATGGPPLLVFAEIRHAGGAIAHGAAGAANDRAREGRFLLEMVGVAPDPMVGLALEAHLRAVRQALAPYVTGATYLNFTEGREKQERSATAFSAGHREALAALKEGLDGADRFCHGVVLG